MQKLDKGLSLGVHKLNIVPSGWITAWANFCCRGGSRPGYIDNSILLREARAGRSLSPVSNYRAVNDDVWALYCEWYGGGPRVVATVEGIENNGKIVPKWPDPTDWFVPAIAEASESIQVSIALVPHVHNEFCERKQHVCLAGNEYRQGESVELSALSPDGKADLSGDIYFEIKFALSAREDIVNPQRIDADADCRARVVLRCEHIDRWLCVRAFAGNHVSAWKSAGPVTASPPKIRNICIEFDGDAVSASGNYVGGQEGQSEWSWIRILPSGERQKIVHKGSHPVRMALGPDDEGSCFKARCKPQRSDGVYGEVVTSKPTAPYSL